MSGHQIFVKDDAPLRIASYYMTSALEPKRVKDAAKDVLKHELKGRVFDTIVGTGFSGTLPLYTISEVFDTHFAFVRKEGVEAHSNKPVEGVFGRNWLFVDDFISGGATFARVWSAVNEMANYHKVPHHCAGAFCYVNQKDNGRFYTLEQIRETFSYGITRIDTDPQFVAQLRAEKLASAAA